MAAITAHVLDTSTGRPAGGVQVALFRRADAGEWTEVGAAITRSDGRASGLSEIDSPPGGPTIITIELPRHA